MFKKFLVVHVQENNVGVKLGLVKEKASPRSYGMIPPATRPSYSERTNVELVHSVGFHIVIHTHVQGAA